MAENNKYLDLPGLTIYDEKIKQKIESDDASILKQSKSYADGLADNYDPVGTAATKVSELESGQVATNKADIATLKSGKADKSTTLSGYGISDAYTKTQTDSAISTAIASADHLKREIVESLPATESADEHTIYMVGTGAGSEDSVYEEYMLINGGFEKVGSSEVDLTNYALKTYVDQAESDAVSSAKGYADSLSDNYATAAQGTKADTALQKASISSGTANGTIAVSGTDVAVKGLGSAAYVATTAFDAAGTAQSKVTELSNGQVTTNKNDIATLKSRVSTLEAGTVTAITEEEITALFS